MLCYEVAGGWVRPVGPRASTDGAFALRWQIDGDNHISDCDSDYGPPVCSADGNGHAVRSFLRGIPRRCRVWTAIGNGGVFCVWTAEIPVDQLRGKGNHDKYGDFLPAFYRRFTGILEITTFRYNALENTRSYAPQFFGYSFDSFDDCGNWPIQFPFFEIGSGFILKKRSKL